ncbi:MAG: hypothetical protein ACRC92_20400 [Peptostreptococcaceae bacterium]
METKVYVTKCKKCGALDSITERVGGQAFINVEQGLYRNKDGSFYLTQWDFSEPEPTPEDFNSQFTDSYYCTECDAFALGIGTQKEVQEELYIIEEITKEELNKIREKRKATRTEEDNK